MWTLVGEIFCNMVSLTFKLSWIQAEPKALKNKILKLGDIQ